MPPYPQAPHGGGYGQGGYQGGYQGQPQQGGYPGGGQQYGGGQGGQGNNDEVEKIVTKLLPTIIRKLEGCCVVM